MILTLKPQSAFLLSPATKKKKKRKRKRKWKKKGPKVPP